MTRFRLGPGLLVSAAFIGPGTIVTASAAGAGYGAALLWTVLFSVAATIIPQEMAARIDPLKHRVPVTQTRAGFDHRSDHPAG